MVHIPVGDHHQQVSWISWEKYYHCEKSLQQACCAPPPPPHTKKREIIFSVFCEKREISLKREGCDYALRRGADSKRKKSVCGGGVTKATHCSDSPTLDDVVQGLASLGLGWGSPALGAVWKQIFQVSASTVEENIIWLSIVSMNKQGLPQTARDVFFFSSIWVFSSHHEGFPSSHSDHGVNYFFAMLLSNVYFFWLFIHFIRG